MKAWTTGQKFPLKKMSSLCDIYLNSRQIEKTETVIEEMERLEDDYSKGSDVAWDYLNLIKVSTLSCHSKKTHTHKKIILRKEYYISRRQTMQKSDRFCVDIKQQYEDGSAILAPNRRRISPNASLFDNNHKPVASNKVWTQLNGAEAKLDCNIKNKCYCFRPKWF